MLHALAALLLAGTVAQVPNPRMGKTYCVGGYEGNASSFVAACARADIVKQHAKWHLHNFILAPGGQECLICYDEEDNTCQSVFLKENPDYRLSDNYACYRLGEQHTADKVVAHVINGEHVSPSRLPPPPVDLEVKVEHLTPGPYTAGDRITAVGAVRDPGGKVRPVSGGVFRVTDASGTVQEHAGELQRDGTVKAELQVPASDSVRIEFVPVAPPLAQGERLRAPVSEAQALRVAVCGFRARVVSPAPGESLVSGQRTALRAALFDAAGQVPVTPLPSGLALDFTVQVQGEAAQKLKASGPTEAEWTPPPSPSPRTVRLSVSGKVGERVVCPASELVASVSDLGLGFDTSALPRTCYVGRPCRGTVTLRRPEPGPARARVDALLADPSGEVRVVDTGEVRYQGPPRADDRYAFEATYTQAQMASWSLVLRTPRGEVAMPTHEVRVRPELRLELPAELDFGTVRAGSEVTTTCKKLDFGRSRAVEEHRWEVEGQGLEGCQSRPVLYFRNALGQADVRPLTPKVGIDALDPQQRALDLCLEVPRCAGDVSPSGAVLRVSPLTPEFAAQAATVRLRWTVEGRGLLSCHASWLLPLLSGLGFMVLLAGYTRPARFPPGASIHVSGSEKGIRQSAAVLLRSCPGSASGFFRDARLGLHGDGDVKGRVRGAVVVLRAVQGGGVVLQGLGPVERQDRRTLRWEPVDDLARGHVPAPGVLYRAGGTYFKVEV
jgi:hypothetical protein